MKTLRFYKVAALMALLAIFCVSCGEDDPVVPADNEPEVPAYVGTWIAFETVPFGEDSIKIQDIMTFTDSTFIDLGKVQLIANTWTDFGSMKGSISIDGNIMNVTVTEIGSIIDLETGMPTESIVSYQEGDAGFDNLLSIMEQPKTFISEFSVSDNKLTLKTDLDGDGVYQGVEEITVYTKQ